MLSLMTSLPVIAFVVPVRTPPAVTWRGAARGMLHMNVKQATQIEAGQALPQSYIEIVTDGCAANDDCQCLTVDEFLAKGKTVLVGMPGAFTPTCTDEHLVRQPADP